MKQHFSLEGKVSFLDVLKESYGQDEVTRTVMARFITKAAAIPADTTAIASSHQNELCGSRKSNACWRLAHVGRMPPHSTTQELWSFCACCCLLRAI